MNNLKKNHEIPSNNVLNIKKEGSVINKVERLKFRYQFIIEKQQISMSRKWQRNKISISTLCLARYVE